MRRLECSYFCLVSFYLLALVCSACDEARSFEDVSAPIDTDGGSVGVVEDNGASLKVVEDALSETEDISISCRDGDGDDELVCDLGPADLELSGNGNELRLACEDEDESYVVFRLSEDGATESSVGGGKCTDGAVLISDIDSLGTFVLRRVVASGDSGGADGSSAPVAGSEDSIAEPSTLENFEECFEEWPESTRPPLPLNWEVRAPGSGSGDFADLFDSSEMFSLVWDNSSMNFGEDTLVIQTSAEIEGRCQYSDTQDSPRFNGDFRGTAGGQEVGVNFTVRFGENDEISSINIFVSTLEDEGLQSQITFAN